MEPLLKYFQLNYAYFGCYTIGYDDQPLLELLEYKKDDSDEKHLHYWTYSDVITYNKREQYG